MDGMELGTLSLLFAVFIITSSALSAPSKCPPTVREGERLVLNCTGSTAGEERIVLWYMKSPDGTTTNLVDCYNEDSGCTTLERHAISLTGTIEKDGTRFQSSLIIPEVRSRQLATSTIFCAANDLEKRTLTADFLACTISVHQQLGDKATWCSRTAEEGSILCSVGGMYSSIVCDTDGEASVKYFTDCGVGINTQYCLVQPTGREVLPLVVNVWIAVKGNSGEIEEVRRAVGSSRVHTASRASVAIFGTTTRAGQWDICPDVKKTGPNKLTCLVRPVASENVRFIWCLRDTDERGKLVKEEVKMLTGLTLSELDTDDLADVKKLSSVKVTCEIRPATDSSDPSTVCNDNTQHDDYYYDTNFAGGSDYYDDEYYEDVDDEGSGHERPVFIGQASCELKPRWPPPSKPQLTYENGLPVGSALQLVVGEMVNISCQVKGGHRHVKETYVTCWTPALDQLLLNVTERAGEVNMTLTGDQSFHGARCSCSASHATGCYSLHKSFDLEVRSTAMPIERSTAMPIISPKKNLQDPFDAAKTVLYAILIFLCVLIVIIILVLALPVCQKGNDLHNYRVLGSRQYTQVEAPFLESSHTPRDIANSGPAGRNSCIERGSRAVIQQTSFSIAPIPSTTHPLSMPHRMNRPGVTGSRQSDAQRSERSSPIGGSSSSVHIYDDAIDRSAMHQVVGQDRGSHQGSGSNDLSAESSRDRNNHDNGPPAQTKLDSWTTPQADDEIYLEPVSSPFPNMQNQNVKHLCWKTPDLLSEETVLKAV